MSVYVWVELRFLSFWTSAVGKGEWLVLRPDLLTAEKETATPTE